MKLAGVKSSNKRNAAERREQRTFGTGAASAPASDILHEFQWCAKRSPCVTKGPATLDREVTCEKFAAFRFDSKLLDETTWSLDYFRKSIFYIGEH